eukprot:CAMPEP_0170612826 /NCGR_PEP_ID=MMETSP0224-20130122/23935_1 /TAXON_ID=285029 /ORGANISM="Togula jolla, Strain CCCM 725" /LENGTH=106 /DNA_ID=CAMNT_0010938365 /DNA_START=18 /DNA_END=335 /DNA_ORIENTATION=+
MIVELVMSLTTVPEGSYTNEFLAAFLRCPLVRGAAANALEVLLSDRIITFPNEAELENYARERPTDVLAALVFRSADPVTGDFPEKLDVEYAVRLHAQLSPPTDRI